MGTCLLDIPWIPRLLGERVKYTLPPYSYQGVIVKVHIDGEITIQWERGLGTITFNRVGWSHVETLKHTHLQEETEEYPEL